MNKIILGLAVVLIIIGLTFYSNRSLLKNFVTGLRQNSKLPSVGSKAILGNTINLSPTPVVLPKTGI